MKKQKRSSFFEYREAWDYLVGSKEYIGIALAIFILFILVGFIYPVFFTDLIIQYMEDLISQTAGFGFLEFFYFIFQNNLILAFLGFLLGLFLGLVPIMYLSINGYILGFVARASVEYSGWLSLWQLLPHGIFELPAILISMAIGIKLGLFPFSDMKNLGHELVYRLFNGFKVFLLIVFPLLLIAAIIESALIVFIG